MRADPLLRLGFRDAVVVRCLRPAADYRALRATGCDSGREKGSVMTERSVSTRFLSPNTMPKPFGYSQVVEVAGGRTVYLAGQVPLDSNNA